jgi:hypothetical protein
VLLTRSPLVYPRRGLTARLACVKHAASVRPEPGSNSPLKSCDHPHEASDQDPEYPGKSWHRSGAVLPKEPLTESKERVPPHLPTGRYCHSSTFGTLLSSQGSSAHRHSASRLAPGQPAQIYRLPLTPSNRFRRIRSRTARLDLSVPERAGPPRFEWRGVGPPGAGRPVSRPCVPPLPGDAENITEWGRQTQIWLPVARVTPVSAQVRAHFAAHCVPRQGHRRPERNRRRTTSLWFGAATCAGHETTSTPAMLRLPRRSTRNRPCSSCVRSTWASGSLTRSLFR